MNWIGCCCCCCCCWFTFPFGFCVSQRDSRAHAHIFFLFFVACSLHTCEVSIELWQCSVCVSQLVVVCDFIIIGMRCGRVCEFVTELWRLFYRVGEKRWPFSQFLAVDHIWPLLLCVICDCLSFHVFVVTSSAFLFINRCNLIPSQLSKWNIVAFAIWWFNKIVILPNEWMAFNVDTLRQKNYHTNEPQW